MALTRTTPEDGHSVSQAVIEAVAEAKGVPPAEIDPPLHEVVDPDALDRLFAPTFTGGDRPSGRIVFTYGGCEVVVRGDGSAVVDPGHERGDRERVA